MIPRCSAIICRRVAVHEETVPRFGQLGTKLSEVIRVNATERHPVSLGARQKFPARVAVHEEMYRQLRTKLSEVITVNATKRQVSLGARQKNLRGGFGEPTRQTRN
jgi:hypothetical protein